MGARCGIFGSSARHRISIRLIPRFAKNYHSVHTSAGRD